MNRFSVRLLFDVKGFVRENVRKIGSSDPNFSYQFLMPKYYYATQSFVENFSTFSKYGEVVVEMIESKSFSSLSQNKVTYAKLL